MYLKPLVIIPARMGSKRIHNKNLTQLGDRPLLKWTTDVAKQAFGPMPYVSTDSPEIARLAIVLGCAPMDRPPALANDEASATAAVIDLVIRLRVPPGTPVVMLQPTTALRSVAHLKAAVAAVAELGFPASYGVGRGSKVHVSCNTTKDGDLVASSFDAKTVPLYINGSVFCAKAEELISQGTFLIPGGYCIVMDAINSLEIDYPDELALAQILAQAGALQ